MGLKSELGTELICLNRRGGYLDASRMVDNRRFGEHNVMGSRHLRYRITLTSRIALCAHRAIEGYNPSALHESQLDVF